MRQEAWNLGIEKSVNAMTQAEKSQLRYYAIMTQVTVAQGDMARTLNAPANQLRILSAQVTQCARAFGNIFIPVLNTVLPYLIAFAKVLRMVINLIGKFVGFELPEVDYSGISSGSDAMGDLTDNTNDATNAAKKLKNAMTGIDELNIISPDDGSSGSGSEFDVQMTKDFKLIVHHDAAVKGVSIWNNDWSTFSKARLENGEPIPTLDEYLTQGEKSSCVLVCELKSQKTTAHELYMTDLVVNSFKGHNLLDPKRVIFISFSLDICKRLALLCPGFTVQYLGGDIAPDVLKTYGINGIDYHYSVFAKHPEWFDMARENGMSINCWTCNREEDIEAMIELGVDCITTDEPQRVRRLMRKSRERRQGK